MSEILPASGKRRGMSPVPKGGLRRRWRKPFLEALRAGHSISSACRLAKISSSLVYLARKENDVFAREWEDALALGNGVIEEELKRRAVDGIEKGVYYQGERVDTELQYSDGLLKLMLQSRMPEKYADRKAVEHKGGTTSYHIPLPCNGRDIIHVEGVCAICDAARAALAEQSATVIDVTPEEQPVDRLPTQQD